MNSLNMIIDRPKHCPKDRNYAIDIILDDLPLTVTSAMAQHIPDLIYRNELSYEQAEVIMHQLIRILEGYPVKSVVTDNTKCGTRVSSF